MDGLTELIQHAEKLYAAVKRLEGSRRGSHSSDQLWANFGEDNKDLSQSKADILASTAAIRRLAAGPTELLQDLARHTELLACLKWLAEFQILACIPVDVTISVKDLADLVGVPQDQLSRVIRLMATFGFLHQPDANSVAHTPLSAQFLDNSWLDAAVFMADHLAPTALQMSLATQRFGASQNPGESAFNLAFNTTRSFSTSVLNSHKLRRQWSAYLDHAAGLYREEDIFQALSQLNWTKLGNVCVVEIGAQSTSMARWLVSSYSNLRIVVQIDTTKSSSRSPESMWQGTRIGGFEQDGDGQLEADSGLGISSGAGSSRITVTYGAASMPQPITDASVYILHLPLSYDTPASVNGFLAAGKAELEKYLDILRVSGAHMLVLTTRLLPEPGRMSNPEVEAVPRIRDLSMLQLANGSEMEMTDVLNMINSASDGAGRLVVTSQLRSKDGMVAALTTQFKAH